MKLNLEARLDVVQFADSEAVFDNADRLMESLLARGLDSPTVGVTILGGAALVEIEYRAQGRSIAAVVRSGTESLKAALEEVGWIALPEGLSTPLAAGYAGEPVIAAA